jgi:hypothetical protein
MNYLQAQKEANIWHFGDSIWVDFTIGTPVQILGSSQATFEDFASYYDSLGNLLLYTNCGGREPLFSGQDGGHIWNRNNVIMYDMQGIVWEAAFRLHNLRLYLKPPVKN